MSVNLCVQFYVIAATDAERVTDLARAESQAGDAVFSGSGPGRQQAWDRAIAALMTTCRDLAVEQHQFRLPHGDRCCSEIAARVREARALPFEFYGVMSPAQLRTFRDALDAVCAEHGEARLIASLAESRQLPETTGRFLTMLRHVLETTGSDRYLVIAYEDGVWDLDDAPAEPIAPDVTDGERLEERLARIARAVSDGRVSKREHAALVRAVQRVSKRGDPTTALLDLAEMLNEIEEKLSSS